MSVASLRCPVQRRRRRHTYVPRLGGGEGSTREREHSATVQLRYVTRRDFWSRDESLQGRASLSCINFEGKFCVVVRVEFIVYCSRGLVVGTVLLYLLQRTCSLRARLSFSVGVCLSPEREREVKKRPSTRSHAELRVPPSLECNIIGLVLWFALQQHTHSRFESRRRRKRRTETRREREKRHIWERIVVCVYEEGTVIASSDHFRGNFFFLGVVWLAVVLCVC